MTTATVTIGGTAASTVYKIGHGLMLMTWVPTPVPDEQCFEAIKAGMDKLPTGVKMVLNSAEFYGFNPPEANLELIARFFEKYPEYAEKAFLVVKGGVQVVGGRPSVNLTADGLRASAENIVAKLRGTHVVDVFEPARMSQSEFPLEDVMRTLKTLKEEGLFKHVGLSEVGAETIRKASKIVPIATCEIEVSLWSYEEETKRVIAACRENNVAILAYSPLGRGFLSGKYTKPEDLEDGDFRKRFSRFTDEAMKNNAAVVDALKGLATKKGCTTAQLCIAWVSSLGQHIIPIPGSSKVERTLENVAAGDTVLTADELKEIDGILQKYPVQGGRAVDGMSEALHLWG